MRLAGVFDINEDDVQIYNIKNIKLLAVNLNDIAFEDDWSMRVFKKYNLIFKIAISSLKGCYLFIALTNSHLMVYIYQIKID